MDCVQVAVRIRPLVKSETEKGCQSIIEKVEGEPQVVVKNNGSFTFNYVFNPDDSQDFIYQSAIQENLQKLFMGYNVTILAYGQTGSGKTYTMGTTFDGVLDEKIGIIPRAMHDIFEQITSISSDYTCRVTCSFVELYQEQLYDLLSNLPREQSIIDIREDVNKEIVMPKLTEIKVITAKETTDCLMRGSSGRAVGATAMNSQSSRSHAIFTVTIRKAKITDSNDSTTSKFHLVDLAGSERPKKTKAIGDRFKEGVKINQGLLALGNVISALGSGGQSCGYVGYRDSKLTRLLQDSLGGNSVTLMIACVSPADYNLDETLSTLRYADRARKIKNKPIINQDPKMAEIQRLNSIIEKLRLELLSRMGTDDSVTSIKNDNDNENNTDELLQLRKNIDILNGKNRILQQQLQITLNDVAEIETRATLAETTKEQYQQKLCEIKKAIPHLVDNLNEDQCKEHIKKVLDIVVDIDYVIEKNKLELANEKASFSQFGSSIELQNSLHNELLHTNEVQQKLDAFTTKQLHFNNELRKLNRELCLKEELHQKIVVNLAKFCNYDVNSSVKIEETETQLKELENERDEIKDKLNIKANASAKISEERRKRLQQLELEITELKKKNLQQAKLLKMREKESQKIMNLSNEIQEMKAVRVKLIREMKAESERFKQWKLAKEKEVLQLKEKDRKRENELIRIKAFHDKQKNVFQRKLEETMAVNKRLKDALERTRSIQFQRKHMKSGKIEQTLMLIDHELEIIMSVTDAELALERLMEDRAVLTNRLKEIKEFDPENANEINLFEEELNMRNVQISDLQQKIIDLNIEDKINSLTDGLQNLIESRAALKHLFTTIIEMRREYSVQRIKLDDMKILCETNTEKIDKLQKNIQDLMIQYGEEKTLIEKTYEDKITVLLRELNKTQNNFINGEITPEMNERLKIQQEAFDRYEEIHEECEKYKKMYEDLQNRIQDNKKFKKPYHKQLTKLKEEAIEIIESDHTFTEDEEDDTSNDPDWVKSPLFRVRHTQTFRANASKRSSDGSTRCGCKQSCMSKLCSCRKSGHNCSEACKCSETCMNNKSIKEEPEDSLENKSNQNNDSKSDTDDKENFDDNSVDHSPKRPKIPNCDISNAHTPSYPYLKKKRRPFYN